MGNIVRLVGSEGMGLPPTPLCLDHAQKRRMSPPVWLGYPTTGMQCWHCRDEASPAVTYAHLNNERYEDYIKCVAQHLAKQVDDKQKVFLADAMSTFWPQMFLWGLYYSQTVKAETAAGMLYHLLFEQEATQPLWDTLTEDF